MILSPFKASTSFKMIITPEYKPQILSYQRPTFSSSSHRRCFKSATDISSTMSSATIQKPKLKPKKSSPKKTIYEKKNQPLKLLGSKLNSTVHVAKSEMYLHELLNEDAIEETDDDDVNTYVDDYYEVNNNYYYKKIGDDLLGKLNNNKPFRISRSNYSTATTTSSQSRDGSALSIRNQPILSVSNASVVNLKSNTKKNDIRKKFKNTMRRLMMKPSSMTSNNTTNYVDVNPSIDLNTELKQVRFTSLLSTDAQLSLLKTYEDMIFIELSCIYPHIQSIPRMSTAKFIRNVNKLKVFPNKEDEYNNRVKISGLFETAMKIIDSIQKFKHKLNQNPNSLSSKVNRQSSVCTTNSIVIIEEEEEDDPYGM